MNYCYQDSIYLNNFCDCFLVPKINKLIVLIDKYDKKVLKIKLLILCLNILN